MKKKFLSFKHNFFGSHLEFRVRLFNILAMGGTLSSLLIGVIAIFNNSGIFNVVTNFVTAAISFAILMYSQWTGRYKICYLFTIIGIFIILFPILFFSSGGYHGGMPTFFVFAVVFTIFMLERKTVIFFSIFEILLYVALCIIAYFHPETVNQFAQEQEILTDIIMCTVIVSSVLGVCLYLHFRLYNDQQKKLETARADALAASDAKSRFLANMSHEIRTPIAIMLGMNEVIMRETNSEQINIYGQSVENAGQQLLALIDNILDVSAIEKGKLKIMEERYETAELISSLSVAGENLARRRNLLFKVEVDGTMSRVLKGDMPHVRQIVSNFLSNAAKYTEQGGIMLSFSELPTQNKDEIMLRIAVSDTGVGIKAESIPFLFDSFTRGDTQGRYIEGSGLGLAIAKEYAECMGGRIQVESEVGCGSVFTLELSQKVSDPQPIGDWKQTAGSAHFGPGRDSFTAPDCGVLIVDDNSENLLLIKSLLARTHMRTDTAMNGMECLELASKRRYDVILMDYMMPGMDGEETLRRLKESPGFDTPVIALTANVVAGVREKLLDAGFCQYLSKPVRWRDLDAALLNLLPKERVIIGGSVPTEEIPAETKDELARELSMYGIILEDGLCYVGGDVAKYGSSASIFTGNYDTAAGTIRNLAGENNWANMKFCVHSLKGNARNLGANALSETAAKIERLCETGDGVYISASLPALYLEWERANDGLTKFTIKLKRAFPEPEREYPPVPDFDELLQMLRFNQYQNAMNALSILIEADNVPERVEKLCEIRHKTDELKFREAECLMAALMESEADENGS